MVDLNKQDVEITYRFINKFLKQFVSSQEEEFWNKTFKIDELKTIRNKLKIALKNA